MRLKVLLRFILAIVFGFVGAFIARAVIGLEEAFFTVLAIFSFGMLGFLLPELFELAGRAGVAAVAAQIVKYLQEVQPPHLSVPTLRFKRRRKASKYINPLVLDTSVLVDGRILDIARTGFLFGTLLVGEGVIAELQSLADSSDSLKRGKGRRGLDVLSDLQKEKRLKVAVVPTGADSGKVDDGLVALAKRFSAGLMTLDFNLNKVAGIKKARVLNINELAAALKSVVSPGDKFKLEVRERGKALGQGVGYLADGTMVVIEGGLEYMGKNVEIEVLRVFQTAAGRMIFAKIANES